MKFGSRIDANQPAPWKCATCGCEKKSTAHQRRQVYCSKECMAVGYSKRMTGEANPNHKGVGEKTCQTCAKTFHSYNKSRKFCSRSCAGYSPANLEKAAAAALMPRKARVKLGYSCVCKACGVVFRHESKRLYCDAHRAEARAAQGVSTKPTKRVSKQIESACAHCAAAFMHYPSSARKFCSYECHLASGGALRAGKASGTMTRKYGARKDANHSEIVNAFRQLGADLIDMSNMGAGVPDLLVWCQRAWHLVDVKNLQTAYGRRGLNPRQKEWALEWKGGPVYLISSVEQAADLVNGKLDGLKRFPE